MKLSKLIGQVPMPEPYLCIIGQLLVEWGWLEYRISEAIWHMLGIKRRTGRMLTAHTDIRGPKTSEDIQRLVGRIMEKINQRNQVVHGIWSWDPATERATVREFRREEIHGVPTDFDLHQLQQRLAAIREDKESLRSLLESVQPPQPPTLP
jgi:hypothetical protein